jgi:hypothetical protein
MIDMKRMWAIRLVAAVIGVPGTALALPKGPAGQTCKSSGHDDRQWQRRRYEQTHDIYG